MNKKIIEDLKNINIMCCKSIFELVSETQNCTGLSSKLILPSYFNNEIKKERLSEQEARFLFVEVLNRTNYFYSVETPTENKYSFSGKESRSAATDLTIFKNKDKSFEKIVNVEFKAHNSELEKIRKDIEKLFCEAVMGNWFHILKNIDSQTISALFEKYKNSIKTVCKIKDFKYNTVLFCIAVRDKKWACYKLFNFDEDNDFDSYLEDFFDLKIKVKNGKVYIVKNNNWNIIDMME